MVKISRLWRYAIMSWCVALAHLIADADMSARGAFVVAAMFTYVAAFASLTPDG